MIKCYIIGAVSGIPYEVAVAQFSEMEYRLKSHGLIPVNPMNLVPEGSDWHTAMKICIKEFLGCPAYTILDGHEQSKGAMIEKFLGINLDKQEIKFQNNRPLIPNLRAMAIESYNEQ